MNHEDSEKSTIEKNRNSHFVFSSYCLCVFVVFLPLPGSANGGAERLQKGYHFDG